MSANIEEGREEFARGSLTAEGLRNASYALREIIDGMDEGLGDHPELVQQLLSEGVYYKFQEEHRQVKLVPDFLLTLADAMDTEAETVGENEGEVIIRLRVGGKKRVAAGPTETQRNEMSNVTMDDIKKVIEAILDKRK